MKKTEVTKSNPELLGLSDKTRQILERVSAEYESSLNGRIRKDEFNNPLKSENDEQQKYNEEKSGSNSENKIGDVSEKLPQKGPITNIEDDQTHEISKHSEYSWKIERLIQDKASSAKNNYPASDFMSQAQSDTVNIEDSISQICQTDTEYSNNNTYLANALIDMESQLSQNTEQLLAICPAAIATKLNHTLGCESIHSQSFRSIMTDNLASEYNRLQKQLNLHRQVAGMEIVPFDEVSMASDLESVKTDMLHKEFMDILSARAKIINKSIETSKPAQHSAGSRTSSQKTGTTEMSKQSTVKSYASYSTLKTKDTSNIKNDEKSSNENSSKLDAKYTVNECRHIEQNNIHGDEKKPILIKNSRENEEIAEKYENMKLELFKERNKNRYVIEDLQEKIEEMQSQTKSLSIKSDHDNRSEVIIERAKCSRIDALEFEIDRMKNDHNMLLDENKRLRDQSSHIDLNSHVVQDYLHKELQKLTSVNNDKIHGMERSISDLRYDLKKKAEELQRVQNHMTQWKQMTAKRFIKNFEDELKNFSTKVACLEDMESGFEFL